MGSTKDLWFRLCLAVDALIVISLVPLCFEAEAEAPPSEASVKPGINETWKSDDTGHLVDVLEAEDREIYTERSNLAALTGPLPGATVADVGSGSGFMTEELARLVGESGKVYAADINPHMLKLVDERMKEQGLGGRVETVLVNETTEGLPPASIDLAFVCDTYHHFEYPKSSLASLHRALKPGGQLVVVEFHREEGMADSWVLEHVRAGQEDFTREIEEAGFELINVHDPPFLERNYVLRFQR
jgi:SAM-dependent methyltransferase